VYNGAGKVPPAPFKATMGNELVVVVAGGGVDVITGVVVEVIEVGWVVVEVGIKVVVVEVVMAEVVVCIVVEITWFVDVGWVVVSVVVTVVLQAVKAIAVTSSNDVKTMSHFLLNLFNNSFFSFLLFTFIMRGYV
jgi:hypothetical protein